MSALSFETPMVILDGSIKLPFSFIIDTGSGINDILSDCENEFELNKKQNNKNEIDLIKIKIGYKLGF
jgi:hypothetical protein